MTEQQNVVNVAFTEAELISLANFLNIASKSIGHDNKPLNRLSFAWSDKFDEWLTLLQQTPTKDIPSAASPDKPVSIGGSNPKDEDEEGGRYN